MFHHEHEKRPPSAGSCGAGLPAPPEWKLFTSGTTITTVSAERARRPLPPRPIICERIPNKTTVPLKVWIIASASCFAVCAALVLATVVITKWGATERYPTREIFEVPEPIYANPRPAPMSPKPTTTTTTTTTTEEMLTPKLTEQENEIQNPILEKLSIFKNMVANRKMNVKLDQSLASKPQIHPLHDTTLHHPEKKIEKKDQARYPGTDKYPDFKPNLPDFIENGNPAPGMRRHDTDYYEEYYNDENLYQDYMESNTMTSYLIEKVQELHDWITSDPDFDANNATRKRDSGNQFGQVLKALNESLVEGDVSIIMGKLKEIYFGENYTQVNHTRRVILSNSTDLLSFGILTLDVMLLHNIQLMAWENQEAARVKMMKDPEVFAFNALFLEPGKIEAKKGELYHHEMAIKRQNRPDTAEEFDFGRNLLENVLEIGMSTARAAIHLGRAYKNTKLVLSQLSNRENLNTNIQNQLSRNIDGNTHALNHLRASYNKTDSNGVANNRTDIYTDLDCIWYLYCKNLIATSKLNAPYGTMARINGLALRMLTGELATERALDTMLYEALTGWTELRCTDMFPRCSKVNAAAVVMDSIVLPVKNTQSGNRSRR